MDYLCLQSTVTPETATNALGKSFFYRTHTKWNHIPLSVRETDSIGEFKSSLVKHMWEVIMSDINDDTDGLSNDED